MKPNAAIREQAIEYRSGLREADQPLARLLAYGAGSLSTHELLAVIIGGRPAASLVDAEHLLSIFQGLPGLAQATANEIALEPGFGPSRAAMVKAAFELGRRLLTTYPEERTCVRSPADAANLLMAEMSLLMQEELRVILLDGRNRVMDVVTVYIGSVNQAQVRIGEVFRAAIRQNAVCIVVAHNHPSGDPSPSPEDVVMTRMIVEAGTLLHIDILDHIIIGRQRFVSLKERGLGFK